MFKEIVDDGQRTLVDHKSSPLSTSCSSELKMGTKQAQASAV